jgi:hypothetical protein
MAITRAQVQARLESLLKEYETARQTQEQAARQAYLLNGAILVTREFLAGDDATQSPPLALVNE